MRSAGYLSATAGTTALTLTPEDVTDSMVALVETYSRPDTAGVCVCDGFGVRVVVERRPRSSRRRWSEPAFPSL